MRAHVRTRERNLFHKRETERKPTKEKPTKRKFLL